VADAISHEAIRFKSIRFHDHARPVVELPLNFDDETRIWGLAQDRTEHHLLAAFRRLGGEPRFATACTGLSQSGDAVRVETTAGPLEVDHVIGCDGVRSTVRSLLGLDFPGFDLPKPWSIADVDADDWPDPETFKGYLIDDGDVAVVVPLAKG
ncbi:hypothetical protein HF633_12810, partial [Weissella cibaria]|nr:hypothetical protein [Weissella cibaria]